MNITSTHTSATGRLNSCPNCAAALPLRLSESWEQAADFECTGCGAHFFAKIAEDAPPETRRNVRFVEPSREASTEQSGLSSVVGCPAPFLSASQSAVAEVRPNRQGIHTPLQTAVSLQFDSQISSGQNLILPPQGPPFASRIHGPANNLFDPCRVEQFRAENEDSSSRLATLHASLAKREVVGADVLHNISRFALHRAVHDMDLFVALGMHAPLIEYPSRHSLHVGSLAMALGARLGYDANTLTELGIGCFIHDLGMLPLCHGACHSNRTLSAGEFAEVTKHPVITFELLNRHRSWISAGARMVAYQMHERCDGSGYPRGRKANQIHPLAKVASVADVFVALLSPRLHRPPTVPYYAVEKIVYDAKNGLYDPDIVRAFLDTVSLFPIGSWVELNDRRLAQVVRSGGRQWDRPVVEAWDHPHPDSIRTVIDLSETPHLSISRPVVSLESQTHHHSTVAATQ
jgi:HD-GYP domain-containing protein (c-di-GMP phosphodiesterase class II)